MSKSTPGPWILEKQHSDMEFTAIGSPIAVVGGDQCREAVEFVIGKAKDWGPDGDDVTTANARLIAAAPDLLKTCKKMHRTLTSRSRRLLDSTRKELEPWILMLEKEIAKAEGAKP